MTRRKRKKNQGTRKQLAQELGIPLSQIDQVIAEIQKHLGHPIPDTTLLDYVRHHPQTRALCRKIQRKLFPPEPVPQIIKLPKPSPSAQDETVQAEIKHLASLLRLPVPEAAALHREIKQQIKIAFNDSDLFTVVKALKPTEAIPTVDQIVEVLEIHLVATRLALTTQQVQQLPHAVMDRLRLPVTFNDILQFLEIATPPVSVQDIYNYFYREWKSAFDLTRLLHISDGEAWQYMVQIRELVSWSVPHHQLLETIKSLPHNQKSPMDVAFALDRQLIAQRLRLSLTEARNLTDSIRQHIAKSISNRQIIAAIPFFELDAAETYETQFHALWEIATTFDHSIEQAGQFFQEIKTQSPAGTTYAEIQEAFDSVSIHNISTASVLNELITQQTARRLNLAVDDFICLPGEISEEIDAHVSPKQIEEIVNSLGDRASVAEVREHFWRKQYPIPQIAAALGIKAATARKRLWQIKQDVPFQIDDAEIMAAIESLPDGHNTTASIISCIYARQIAAQLYDNPQRANDLLREMSDKTGQNISGQDIAAAWAVLPAEHKTFTDLIGLMQTKILWQKSLVDTLEFAQTIQAKMAKPIPLSQLWSLIQSISPALQNKKGILTYLSLRHLLQNDNPDTTKLNHLAGEISRHNYESRFWNFVSQCDAPDKLTIRDIEYLLTLIHWMILNILTPDKSQGELWLTRHTLISRLSGITNSRRHFQQAAQLTAYSQKCWQTILSTKRQYQVPSNGRAEVEVPVQIASLINLHSVRFVQERVKAPGLFIQFKFRTPALLGIIRIDPSGEITGFHELIDDLWYRALIQAVAFSHYRDLVVPSQIQQSSPLPAHRQPTRKQASTPGHHTTRAFPLQRPQKKQYSLADWYESQEIARHSVRGHTRWIASDFVASGDKHLQARRAGVTLQHGYTWVIEHERGNPKPTKIPLEGEDLLEHTIFTSPPRAEAELEKILR